MRLLLPSTSADKSVGECGTTKQHPACLPQIDFASARKLVKRAPENVEQKALANSDTYCIERLGDAVMKGATPGPHRVISCWLNNSYHQQFTGSLGHPSIPSLGMRIVQKRGEEYNELRIE